VPTRIQENGRKTPFPEKPVKRTTLSALIIVLAALAIRQVSASRLPSPPVSQTSQARSSPTPDTRAADAQYLAEVKQKLVSHEDELAETFFKNIEILKDKKASRLPAMMSALTGLLGVSCSHCHVPNEWAREDKPTKQTARKMFRMIGRLNKEEFDGKNAVSCWTCHRGNPHPPIQ